MGFYLEKGQAAKNLLILVYRRTAKKKNYAFRLSTKYFFELTKQNCHYCGSSPRTKVSSSWPDRSLNGDYLYNGLDRKDNTKGYTKNNCLPCCSKCNYLKGDLTYKEFIKHIKQIYNHIGTINANKFQ